jgi:NitT/TauT family transport system ATP-binding protein
MLEVKNITYSYNNKPLLENISFSLETGSFTSLIGGSGAGKSSLLKILCGFLAPAYGTITIEGKKCDVQDQISYLTQNERLLPWRTCLENILLLDEIGYIKNNSKEEALFLLEEVGLKDNANSYPETLSGGMYQRVCLARALYHNYPYLFLDEPFTALDLLLRESLYKLLQKMQKKREITILMVTHDFRDVLELSDNIFVLCKGKISKKFNKSSNWKDNKKIEQQLREALKDNTL